MKFADAAIVVVPFGKYRGKKIDKIAESDEGLLYLDWLLDQDLRTEPLRTALAVYLSDETVAKQLDALVRK